VLGEIDRLLALSGSSKERIVSATIYLADIKSFPELNRAWEAWVPADAKPARATVQASMVAPEYRVEIQVVAVV
jgi:enamine deaminase RidA (YjgF/YER057c/UK114 family)